jgi:hypothetical protein
MPMVLATVLLCAVTAVVGYVTGHSGGPSVKRARAGGAHIGFARGTTVGKHQAYAFGYKLGYSRGYHSGYSVSYREAYNGALQ